MTSQISIFKLISCLAIFAFLAACGASQSSKPDSDDIYSSLREDAVQYHGQVDRSDLDPAVIQEKVTDIRNLYFRKKLSEAQDQAERLLRTGGNVPEAYYWLARINLDQADYQQAYDTASKGLSIVSDANLRKALERLQSEAQMGNL